MSHASTAWLRAQVYAAPVGDDLVFLDVRQDSYFCWPAGAEQLEVKAHGSAVRLLDAAAESDLIAASLICFEEDVTPRGVAPPRPTVSAVPTAHDSPRWRDIPQALRALFDVAWHYAGRPFSDIVREARPHMPSAEVRPAAPELLALVAQFHRWIPYAPVSAKCLLRSFMLRRLLQRHGHEVYWVFGVATWPFRAHCWLQWGKVVLNDEVDRVAPYQPILVL